jgi:hypothetical protein
MLPYGSIWYHGAPAALQDIPLGTHRRGPFLLRNPNDKSPPPPTWYNRRTPEADFRRCFRIEDDLTYHARHQQLWKIESVDLATMKLTASLQTSGGSKGVSEKGSNGISQNSSTPSLQSAKAFDLLTSTRVMKASGFGELQSIEKGQTALFNLTWATLYGPGRITDVWLDEPSRQLATARQLERHRNYIRERGLAGWVEAVDDVEQIVTITFFGGIDPKLFDELTLIDAGPVGWPL